jgi:Ca2+-binding EF-hand superfamily protein
MGQKSARPIGSAAPVEVPYEVSVAEQHAECAICYDGLPKKPCAVLLLGQRRVCRHFFHHACAVSLMAARQMQCPLCRTSFDGVRSVPPMTDARGWFNVVDLDHDVKLCRVLVLEVLKASIRIDLERLEAEFPALFSRWDIDGDGFLTFDEVTGPNGLAAFVSGRFPQRRDSHQMPISLSGQRARWFQHWDTDGSGTLEREEVIRAFLRTFHWHDPERAAQLRMVVEALWLSFDPDGNGSITCEEFVRRDGLADTVEANLSLSSTPESQVID